MQTTPDPLRHLLRSALNWEDAHASFDSALADLPEDKLAAIVPGIPWSLWQLVEHMRRAQHDILDFCINPHYEEKNWPGDYWPASVAPPAPNAWQESVAAFKKDLAAVQQLADDPRRDLFATIPHGTGQTYLREIVLVIDHNAYHVGQIVALRRALGAWSK